MSGVLNFVLAGSWQIALFALLAPAVIGLLRWFKARLQLRRGAPIGQPYLDLLKLARKKSVPPPKTASWVFTAAPYIVFVCYALLSWAVPPFYLRFAPLDLLAVVYLLGLARFALALAGMDAGAPVGGLGSSREMFMNALIEPALILVVGALAIQYLSTDLGVIAPSGTTTLFRWATLVFLWLALALITLIENGRLPIDNQETHLELTMIQKALHLEYSGRKLALIEWAEAMRLTFFLSLLGRLLLPRDMIFQINWMENMLMPALYLLTLLLGVGLLALLETMLLKLRLRRVIWPGAVAIALALTAIFIASINIIER